MRYNLYSPLTRQVPSVWFLRLLGSVTIVLILTVIICQAIGYGKVLNDKNSGNTYFWCSAVVLLFALLALVCLFYQRTIFAQRKAKKDKATDAPRQPSANGLVPASARDGISIISGTEGQRTDDSESVGRSTAANPGPSSSASARANHPASLAKLDGHVNIPEAESFQMDQFNPADGSRVEISRPSSGASTSSSAGSSRKGKERQTSHDEDQDRQTFNDEDKERQTVHDEDKGRQTIQNREVDRRISRWEVLLDATFQLALCWLVLTLILLHYNGRWWTTLHQFQYRVTYNSTPRLRTPGVMFLTSSQDPFQTSLGNATQPPVCGFRDYYGSTFKDCPWNGTMLIEDPRTCNCTSNIRDNNNLTAYTATATDPQNMTYFLYHFAPPIQVTKTSLSTVYYVWPNFSKRQINVEPSEPLVAANCSRSQINVVFYDPESTDAINGNWTNILASDDNPMYPLPAGSAFHVQVQRNTFKNVTDQSPRTYFTASWGPPMQTGDCSVLFSVSYATMQQKDTVAVPVKEVSDYVALLGGILALIQAVATISLWMVVLSSDLLRLRRRVVNPATATGA